MSHVAHVGDVLAMHARMYSDKVGARDLEREMTFRIWYNRACRLAIGKSRQCPLLGVKRTCTDIVGCPMQWSRVISPPKEAACFSKK